MKTISTCASGQQNHFSESGRTATHFPSLFRLPLKLNRPALCAFAVSLAVSGVIQAQDAGDIEEISVTGTRIIRSGVDTPTPVTTVTSAELDRAAPGNLIDALTTLPQFFGNITPEQVTGGQNSGGSNVNLRGAGVNRTLVLLDGRRVVPSNRFGTVDVSVFPESLVERVETITGGASASYGTDAVAGVVNFILDTDFEGFKANSQYGTTRYGDGDNYELGFAFGHRFDNGLHVLGAYETFDRDRINSFDSLSDRDFYVQRARITNPDPNGPNEIIRPFVSPTNYTNGGIINQPGSSLNNVEFLPDGSYQPLPFSGVGQLNGGCNCQSEPTQSYGVDGDNEVQSGFERDSLFLRAGYDITPDVNVFAQVLYGNTVTTDRRESIALLGPWGAEVFSDNPYLPQGVRQTMMAEGLDSVGFGFFARNAPDSPLGESFHETDNEFTSTTLGVDMRLPEGGFLGGWQLSAYYDYGENTQDFIARNAVRVDRLPMALDAVDDGNGNTVCRVTLYNAGTFDDCVPLDVFGGVDNVDPAARAFVMDDGKIARQETKQQFAEIVLTGEVWEGLDAGPVFGAFGGSWREQELAQSTLDPSDEFPATTDGTLLSDLGLNPEGLRGVLPEDEGGVPGLRHVPSGFKGDSNSSSVLFTSLREIAGEYDVKEAFGELNIPLLANRTLVQMLELDLAARWADYAGSGEIWAWKSGISWQVNDQWRLRGTRSRDVRAATLQERFDQTRGGTNVLDPERNNALTTTASFSGGNEGVLPEEADTTTIGAVYQPVWADGLSFSLDWYDIDVQDAIDQLSSQNVVDGCFQGDASLCQFVHRDPASNEIVRVDNLFINLANQRISGMDLEVNYSFPVTLLGGADELMTWRFFGTWLEENSIKNPDAPRDDRVGQMAGGFGLPEYKLTSNLTYTSGPFTAFLQGRWIDSGILDRFRTEGVDIDDNTVDSVFYTDLNLSYSGQQINGQWGWEVFFNVTNLFDEEPPPAPGTVGRTGTNEFNTGLHDVLGRRYMAGLRVNF